MSTSLEDQTAQVRVVDPSGSNDDPAPASRQPLLRPLRRPPIETADQRAERLAARGELGDGPDIAFRRSSL